MDMKSNQYYKNEALSALRGNWANALVATIILIALALFFSSNDAINSYYQRIVINPFIGYSLSFVSLFVLLPLAVGYSNSMRVLLETGDNRLTNNSFSLGFGNWLHVVWGMILSTIYIFLWTLLLIIPGIIKSYSYALTPYILVEHPEMSANEAIEESMRLMDGHKFDLFYLQLSFIGWAILSILSLGLGFFWLIPYQMTAQAAFYRDIKNEAMPLQDNVIEPERVL